MRMPQYVAEAIGSDRMILVKIAYGIYFAGWLLQLYWAVGIVKKVHRKLSSSKTAKLKKAD